MSDSKVSFSLSGCGFLGIYHIGAVSCLNEHVPHLLENARFAGASAGALIACCLICKVPMNMCIDFTLRLARSSREFPLGGWEPNVHIEAILRNSIDLVLPQNAHELCAGRLFVSVSTLPWCENKLVSEFKTREDLIDVLMCSSFVPAFSAYGIPKYKGEYLVDGGLSDNLPVFDEDTITICPWSGEHSICPRDPEGQAFPLTLLNMSVSPTQYNLMRFKDAFYSPMPGTLKNYCWQGYDDALHYLSENELIHCNTHRVLTHLTHLEHRVSHKTHEQCDDCEHHRHHARNSQLSPEILAHWEMEEGENPISYKSLVLVPVKKMINIWLIPVTMIKEYIIQLFLVAYFRVEKVKKSGFSEDVVKLLESLRNPRALLFNLMVETASKVFFSAVEYGVRLCSEVFAILGSLQFAKRIICREICHKCGQRASEPPGAICQMEEACASQAEGADTETSEEVPVVVVHPLPEAEAEVPVLADTSRKREQADDMAAEAGKSLSQDPADMAIWLDIKTQSVDMAIPIAENTSEGAQDTVPEMVRVEGVGEIEEVVMDKVAVNPLVPMEDEDEDAAEAEASIRTKVESRQREPRVDRIHQYVHKFEQYKNVMTLHYVDENHVRHTESLFVEEPVPADDGSATSAANVDNRADEQPTWVCDDVGSELKHLLEEKVLKPQREFEKEYQRVHQKRLKRKNLKEVRQGTGHFSLQVISFSEDLPSPSLSRSSSVRNVSLNDDFDLVRSVSDACSLASSIRSMKKRREGPQRTESASHSNLVASKQYTSLESLVGSPPALFERASSDTTSVASNLKKMKMENSDGGRSVKRSRLPRGRGGAQVLSSTDSTHTLVSDKGFAQAAGSIGGAAALDSKSISSLTSSESCQQGLSQTPFLLPLAQRDRVVSRPSQDSVSPTMVFTASDLGVKPSKANEDHLSHRQMSASKIPSFTSIHPYARPHRASLEKKIHRSSSDREMPTSFNPPPSFSQTSSTTSQLSSHAGANRSYPSKKPSQPYCSEPPSPSVFHTTCKTMSGANPAVRQHSPDSAVPHQSQKEKTAIEGRSTESGGKLVRTHTVRRSQSEMSSLMSSLKELKSERQLGEESSSGEEGDGQASSRKGGKVYRGK